MTLKKYNLQLEESDWEYLGKIADIMGQSRAQIIRGTLMQFTATLKNTFGENPGKTPANIAEFYKSMILETSRALAQVAEVKDTNAK